MGQERKAIKEEISLHATLPPPHVVTPRPASRTPPDPVTVLPALSARYRGRRGSSSAETLSSTRSDTNRSSARLTTPRHTSHNTARRPFLPHQTLSSLLDGRSTSTSAREEASCSISSLSSLACLTLSVSTTVHTPTTCNHSTNSHGAAPTPKMLLAAKGTPAALCFGPAKPRPTFLAPIQGIVVGDAVGFPVTPRVAPPPVLDRYDSHDSDSDSEEELEETPWARAPAGSEAAEGCVLAVRPPHWARTIPLPFHLPNACTTTTTPTAAAVKHPHHEPEQHLYASDGKVSSMARKEEEDMYASSSILLCGTPMALSVLQ